MKARGMAKKLAAMNIYMIDSQRRKLPLMVNAINNAAATGTEKIRAIYVVPRKLILMVL